MKRMKFPFGGEKKIGRLIIPINSLFLLKTWHPQLKILELAGSGEVTTTGEMLKSAKKYMSVFKYAGTKLFIKFKCDGMNSAKSLEHFWNETTKVGVPDAKISKLSYFDEYLLDGKKNWIWLNFEKITPHAGIFKKIVSDGMIPNQDLTDWHKSIKKLTLAELREKKINTDIFKTIKNSALVLTSTFPKEMIYNRDLIFALRQKNMVYFEDTVTDWSLKELKYVKKTDVNKR